MTAVDIARIEYRTSDTWSLLSVSLLFCTAIETSTVKLKLGLGDMLRVLLACALILLAGAQLKVHCIRSHAFPVFGMDVLVQ